MKGRSKRPRMPRIPHGTPGARGLRRREPGASARDRGARGADRSADRGASGSARASCPRRLDASLCGVGGEGSNL